MAPKPRQKSQPQPKKDILALAKQLPAPEPEKIVKVPLDLYVVYCDLHQIVPVRYKADVMWMRRIG